MDDDSCSKFIGSLTKYLQSLCHSYVDFDNGVELVGHIYLNVDKGKKIDYVLNESVCKNGANVVKFTSNSYHAQPVEKKDGKKETPKKDSREGKRIDGGGDDDVIIVGSEGSRRNRTPGSSPLRTQTSPSQMGRGMGMNRMSPGGMFRSPRGMSPRFGGPVPRPSGYTYQPRQRLQYPQSPRNLLTGYSPRMRQPYQPRGPQPLQVRGPTATPGSSVDTDVAFMREEYVPQTGQVGASTSQACYQTPYGPGQQGQVSPNTASPGQQYGAPYTSQAGAMATTGMTVPMTAPTTTAEADGALVNTADPSLSQQAQSGGMPLPVTTHTIFDSGPVMAPMDLPTSVECGSSAGITDPLAVAMNSAGVTTDNSGVPTTSSGMGLDASLLIGKVWSDTNSSDPSTGTAGQAQSVSSFATGDPSSSSAADSMHGGTGFDIFNQQPGTTTFSSSLNQTSGTTTVSGVDGDGFSALVSELQAFNQQAGAAHPSSSQTLSLPTTNSSSSSASDTPSYGVSRTGERVLIKRDPGAVKRDLDISANITSSVLQESTEAYTSAAATTTTTTSQVSGDNFLGGRGAGVGTSQGGKQHPGASPGSGNLVGPESVVIETKPFLHHSTDYDATETASTSESPQGPSQASSTSQPRPPTSSTSSTASSSSPTPPLVNVKKERKDEEEKEEEETIKHASQSEWQNKNPESDWVTDMSALNNSDDSNQSFSDTAQDDDDPNYTPGRPLGPVDKISRKRVLRRPAAGPKNPKSPATKSAPEPTQQQARTFQRQQAPLPQPPPHQLSMSDDNVVNILDSDEEDQCGSSSTPGGDYALPPGVRIKQEKMDEMIVKKEPVDDYENANLSSASSPKRRVAPAGQGDPGAGGMKRKVWTDREKDAVHMYFSTYLDEGTLPGKVEIEAVIAAEPSLQGRTWTNIKDYLRNAQLCRSSSKRPLPKASDKGSKSKRRRLDTPESGDDQSHDSDEDSDPPLPELPPSLDSDQNLEPDYDDTSYKPGTFVLVNVTKDSDRSSRMRPTHTPAEVIVPPEGEMEGVWVHVLVPAGAGLWRLPNVDQTVDLHVDPADIIKPLEKSHVNIVGNKVLYRFDDIDAE